MSSVYPNYVIVLVSIFCEFSAKDIEPKSHLKYLQI